jgi:signal transduction histidine kinase
MRSQARYQTERLPRDPEAGVGPDRFASWLLGSLSSGVVGIDDDGVVVAFNAGAERILGGPDGASAVGRDCREVLAGQPALARLLLETVERRSPLSRAEMVLEGGPEAPTAIIGLTLSPVRDDQGEPCGAAALFRDLAPIERSDEQERLHERLAALGQMAAGLAHEIRNPLAGMEVLVGLLRRRLADRPDELSLLAELTGELRALATTVTESLEFVRPLALAWEDVAPARLLEEALAVARARVPFAGRVEHEGDAVAPVIRGDPEQLRTVLTNLLVNALESMAQAGGPAPPRLRLGLRCRPVEAGGRSVRVGSDGSHGESEAAAGREVVITVSDTGAGVPAELREKVFYPFFTTKQKGSGLGLATAQKIVASHGGSLGLENGDPGCTFRLRLPVGEGSDG